MVPVPPGISICLSTPCSFLSFPQDWSWEEEENCLGVLKDVLAWVHGYLMVGPWAASPSLEAPSAALSSS